MDGHVPDRALQPVAAGRVRAALAASAGLGMFFALADPARDPAGWQPASALYAAGGGPLGLVLESTRGRLAGCESRVAASLFFQGYAARLLSPQLGCIAMGGCVPGVPAARLRWRSADSEMMQLGMTPGPGWRAPADVLIERMVAIAFGEHLLPLAGAVRARTPIAGDVLRDNVASALISGLALLSGQLGPGWRALAAHALSRPELRGCGSLRESGPVFVRRSCCLYYRLPGGRTCGDCPLGRPR
ncbi:MAG: (2Fe-2S)-binding protein, partial [Streptosporangiaceae bacterium]